MGVCAFSVNLNWLLQPQGHVTCKLHNHYFLECRDGGAFTCEIKSTGGLPWLRDSIVFQWVLPPTHEIWAVQLLAHSLTGDSHETGSCQLAYWLQVLSFGLPWALYIGFIVCVRYKDEILTEQFIAHMNATPLCFEKKVIVHTHSLRRPKICLIQIPNLTIFFFQIVNNKGNTHKKFWFI
jgi:hypothetical protein